MSALAPILRPILQFIQQAVVGTSSAGGTEEVLFGTTLESPQFGVSLEIPTFGE